VVACLWPQAAVDSMVAAGSGGFYQPQVSYDFVGSRQRFVTLLVAGGGRFCWPRVSDYFVGSRRWFILLAAEDSG